MIYIVCIDHKDRIKDKYRMRSHDNVIEGGFLRKTGILPQARTGISKESYEKAEQLAREAA